MRLPRTLSVALGLALVALPVAAAIKAMTLAELMDITTDTVHGTILEKSSFRMDWPFEGAVYTQLTIEGESLRTQAPVTTQVVFLGSHDPADHYNTSETPTLQDTRVGGEAVVFFYRDAEMPGQLNRVFDLSGVYRIERAFGTPVVIGKGEGFAFPENIKLTDARTQVRAAHLALEAAKAK
ncbi:MAG: hypothetical protein ACYTG2_06715 [Planctomycetota bacterium]|jgi:hypothetical protein